MITRRERILANRNQITMETKNVKPTESAYKLTKVKLMNGGGLQVRYEVTESIGSEVFSNKYEIESAKDVHPDLSALFNDLVPIMGRVFNITSFLSVVECKDFKATAAQNQKAREFADECLSKIEIRGVSLSGDGDNLGIVITGLFTTPNGQKTCINSPRLRLTDEYGFEEILEQIIEKLRHEVYEFLFNNKRAQLELFE